MTITDTVNYSQLDIVLLRTSSSSTRIESEVYYMKDRLFGVLRAPALE